MEIKISGNPKEIADLALALQNRQKTKENKALLIEQLNKLSKVSNRLDCLKLLPQITYAMIALDNHLREYH